MVRLEPMSADDFETWQPRMWRKYRDSLVKVGVSAAEAGARAAAMRATLVPGGELPAGHHALSVIDDGPVIGSIWLAERTPGDWYIYDLDIDREHRGKGHGRATVLAAERFARARGAEKIECNVFSFNERSQNLFRSLGYHVAAMTMAKPLN